MSQTEQTSTAAPPATSSGRFVEQLLPYLLAQASHLVSEEFYARLKRHGVSVRRWRLLATLWDGDGLTIGELSRAILIEQSSTTRLVDRAVADGLVEKRTDARDRRRVRAHITRRGRETVRQLIDDAVRADGGIAGDLPAGAAERLKRDLRRLIETLSATQRR